MVARTIRPAFAWLGGSRAQKISEKIGRLVGQSFTPTLIESGLFVGVLTFLGGHFLISLDFGLPYAFGPPFFMRYSLRSE